MLGTFHDRSPEFRVAGVSMCVLFTFGHVERQGFKSRIRGRECSSENETAWVEIGQGDALGTSAHSHFLAFAHIAPIWT